MFCIHTLGRLDFRGEAGVTPEVIGRPKRMALLIYLAVERPGEFHQRDALLNLLWAESSQDRGRHALRQSLYVLRRAIGASVLRSRADGAIGLEMSGLRCDLVDFDRAYGRGDYRTALDLSRGPFLDCVFLDPSPPFEDWLQRVRLRHSARAAECALREAESACARGECQEAVEVLRRGLEIDPFNEVLFRQLAATLVQMGRRADAVQSYHRFREQLADELEMLPAPETELLLETMLAPVAVSPVGTITAPI
jgi:DNA-binding SARP family transcriptional activator